VETALAGASGDRQELLNEAADLVYHLLVLLSSVDVTPAEVWTVLEHRHTPKKP